MTKKEQSITKRSLRERAKKICSKCNKSKSLNCFRKSQNAIRGNCILCERLFDKLRNLTDTRISSMRRSSYKKKFGLTVEQYEDLYENQLGHCAICLEHQCNLKKRLAIDHIHGTKKVRGLLCNDCNSGIGLLGESLGILESAKQYLLEKNR